MIFHSIDKLLQTNLTTEPIVIVGAGAIGLFLAKCLLDRGHKNVILLEAGRAELGAFEPNSYRVVGRKHDGVRIGRSRSLGGTSNLWGGQLVEFADLDFRQRDWVPNSGWPISYDELRPHYLRSFELLGIAEKFLDDNVVWRGVVGAPPSVGPGVEIFLTRWMNVPSLALQLRTDLYSSPHLRVLLNHTVNGFRFSSDSVSQVRVRTPENTDQYVPAGTVVIAAGTIESSRLMLAAAKDECCPWRDNEMIGRRFQDHLGGKIATLRPKNRKEIDRIFATVRWKGLKFQPKVRLTRNLIEERKVLAALGMICFESSVSENLNFLKQFLKAAIYSRRIHSVKDFMIHASSCMRYLPPLMLAYLKDHRILSPVNASISLVVQAEQCPIDDSQITIDEHIVDAVGLPQVILNWRLGGQELSSIRELAVECDREFKAANLAELEIDPLLLACDPKMLDKLCDTNHSAGGCIMSNFPDQGVVDRNLRIFGTQNAYIVGASTFPTSSDANVTFTAMALACRLADNLTG